VELEIPWEGDGQMGAFGIHVGGRKAAGYGDNLPFVGDGPIASRVQSQRFCKGVQSSSSDRAINALISCGIRQSMWR
jgi:hypothetical protein